jgi:hypothetical protein
MIHLMKNRQEVKHVTGILAFGQGVGGNRTAIAEKPAFFKPVIHQIQL